MFFVKYLKTFVEKRGKLINKMTTAIRILHLSGKINRYQVAQLTNFFTKNNAFIIKHENNNT